MGNENIELKTECVFYYQSVKDEWLLYETGKSVDFQFNVFVSLNSIPTNIPIEIVIHHSNASYTTAQRTFGKFARLLRITNPSGEVVKAAGVKRMRRKQQRLF